MMMNEQPPTVVPATLGEAIGGEDPVDVGDLEPGVLHGVVDRLDVQAELALAGERADLVALVHTHDANGVAELAHLRQVAHRAPPAGRNIGRLTWSVSFSKQTSTGMSQRISLG